MFRTFQEKRVYYAKKESSCNWVQLNSKLLVYMYYVIYQTTNKSNLKYFFFIMIAFAFESKVIYKKSLTSFYSMFKTEILYT